MSVFYSKSLQDTLDRFISLVDKLPIKFEKYFFYNAQVRLDPKSNDTTLVLDAWIFPAYDDKLFTPVGIRPAKKENEFIALSYSWPDKNYPDSIFNIRPSDDKYKYHIYTFRHLAGADWALNNAYSIYKIVEKDSLRLIRTNLYDKLKYNGISYE